VKKILTREQAQTSKDRAARFVLNVLQDQDGAQAIEDESLDDWAERKKITLRNPRPIPRRNCPLIHEGKEKNMATKKPTMAELLEENEQLKEENDDLNDQLDQVADIIAGDDDDDQDDGDDDDNGEDDDQD
jgi:uncharacterized protein YabE (DUF348 family)